jgi:hypothetical protein
MVNSATFEFSEIVGDKLLDVGVFKETPEDEFHYQVKLQGGVGKIKLIQDGEDSDTLMSVSGSFAATTMEDFFTSMDSILKPFYQALKS